MLNSIFLGAIAFVALSNVSVIGSEFDQYAESNQCDMQSPRILGSVQQSSIVKIQNSLRERVRLEVAEKEMVGPIREFAVHHADEIVSFAKQRAATANPSAINFIKDMNDLRAEDMESVDPCFLPCPPMRAFSEYSRKNPNDVYARLIECRRAQNDRLFKAFDIIRAQFNINPLSDDFEWPVCLPGGLLIQENGEISMVSPNAAVDQAR
ncbi:MAG: hypothetical protein NTX76_00215 [Alphaproteobacteria bacterium]|nr:hypothetical protein [Alphaproteobacteria bacterium]